MKLITSFVFIISFHFSFSQEWTVLSNAPTYKYRFDDIYFINDTTGWAVDGAGHIYKTKNKNQSWEVQLSTGRYMRSIEFINDTIGFAGTVDSAFYMTTNAGKIWTRIDKTKSFNVPGICGISHRGDAVILTGAYFGSPFVIRSFDRGNTWSYQDMSSYAGGLVDAWYKSADTVFVSGTSVDHKLVILRSADKGDTWTDLTPANPPSGWGWKWHFPTASVGYVAIEEVTPNDQPTSTSTHFLKSTDGGRSWSVMEAKVGNNIDLQGLGFADANRGWIGGWSTGMYETNDGGLTWKLINNFSNLNRFFFLRKDFGYVSGTTIFKFQGKVVTNVQSSAEPSRDAHTLEIYPNPVNRESFAKVTLGNRTLMVLNLLDMNGKTVKEIYKGYAEAGVHQYKIETDDLVLGEYIVQLLTHEHFLAKRLVKIKN